MIGIAGAGLLGRLVALELARAGRPVTLFDREPDARASCSWVGAGMLTPWAELDKAEPIIAALGTVCLDRWQALVATLPSPVFFQREGSLVVAHRRDMTDLEHFRAHVAAGLDEPARMEAVDGSRIAELEPELGSRFTRGIYFPHEGQVDNRAILPALGEALTREGVGMVRCEIAEVGSGLVIDAGGRRYDMEIAIDCRGLGSRDRLRDLRGVRGELIRVHAPEVTLKRPVRLMHPRYPLYIVPREHGVYLIGATQIESDDLGEITVKSSLELLSAAYSLHPGFAEARVIETAVHCRPAFPDNLPRVTIELGLIRANGLFRHGYLIGPAVAETVVDLVLDRPPRHDRLTPAA